MSREERVTEYPLLPWVPGRPWKCHGSLQDRGPQPRVAVHLASLCAVSKSLLWASKEPNDFPQRSRVPQALPNLPRPVPASVPVLIRL